MGVSGRAREERERFDAFYREKWREHEASGSTGTHRSTRSTRRPSTDAATRPSWTRRARTLGRPSTSGVGSATWLERSPIPAPVSWRRTYRSRTQGGAGRTLVAGDPALVVQGEGEHLPFGDAAFDLVILADVIEHVDSVEATLREVARVLRFGRSAHLRHADSSHLACDAGGRPDRVTGSLAPRSRPLWPARSPRSMNGSFPPPNYGVRWSQQACVRSVSNACASTPRPRPREHSEP